MAAGGYLEKMDMTS